MKCSIKQKILDLWHWIISDPKSIIRFCVLFACSIIVIFQLSECFSKLRHPPITTQSHFELNETLSYPAVTFCRSPPYKIEELSNYGLYYHPDQINGWRDFPFENVTLEELFNETTYGPEEFFVYYGLDTMQENIKIESHLHFNMGKCHTILPLVTTRRAWKDVGYTVLLKHDISDPNDTPYEIPPGWHMFIHDPSDTFTENRMQTSGRVEYMYVTVGEEVEVKLTVQHFTMMEDRDNTCTHDHKYSATECGEICRWRQVTDVVGCSGPWMPSIKMPQCKTLNSTLFLIKNYTNLEERDDSFCNCEQPCSSIIYSAFVMKREEYKDPPNQYPSSQVFLYYTSKMVTLNEERLSYDLSQFVADMGGSLGFLLGLSVLGLIGILEKIILILLCRFPKRNKKVEADEQTVETPTNLKNDLSKVP